MKKEIMSPKRLVASLAIRDLTDPKNGIHAINLIIQKVELALKEAYSETIIEEIRTDPIVSVKNNFEDLLFPEDNLGRSSRYTRYVAPDKVLRTHTSAAIPDWLKKEARDGVSDAIVVLPGICYRRDVVNKIHCGEPHQMDIWRVRRGNPRFGRPDLIHLIETILNATVPGYKYRANEVKHPYTINGLEVEILVNEEWLEVLECGEAHPVVLGNAGFDHQEYSGLALGMGLDRLVMITKKIDDIRILRSDDTRIKRQMVNLDKFINVSDQPAAKRVLSFSTYVDQTEEDVCEEIRDELGPEATYIEEIRYSEISYEQLPTKARENLGIRPDQKNIVVTLIFRSPEGSLQRTMVNEWMQHLYPKLNKGDKGYM
ncbi:MAG: Phenylalanyl-tRNA synthetase domain protein [Parcubacteria group bacterium GW2011_GWB1_36_5]|uniref:Phenylalanyl-tRNA synthetase domain protein n=1 Tax=Candidatus Curtissbacteria bacterium GW2011_GWC2_38_9 TaxID=1618414 RepID=A0A0G0LN34_9BACT|nr:MAG: Phenylalanyl-tRNA synthetase domain protein [Parcubacteria group bacterium GW2011_GWB1_36_5]KKQ89375.1 MAG: Phenylalanyl-tRNA synthetase domain protein [Candidatus Curtissbacteria bacterium GW2011_GWC2_38_9]